MALTQALPQLEQDPDFKTATHVDHIAPAMHAHRCTQPGSPPRRGKKPGEGKAFHVWGCLECRTRFQSFTRGRSWGSACCSGYLHSASAYTAQLPMFLNVRHAGSTAPTYQGSIEPANLEAQTKPSTLDFKPQAFSLKHFTTGPWFRLP